MKMAYEIDNDPVKVELEIDESAGELDVAREKFETALHQSLYREEVSDSDAEDLVPTAALAQVTAGPTPSTRPPRKRRRKDADSSTQGDSGGCGVPQQSKLVVRMFDRSVDLARFDCSTPLYPICRAWLLNEPHQGDGSSELNQVPPSPPPTGQLNSSEGGGGRSSPLPDVHFLPTPESWGQYTGPGNPLIPRPITPPPLHYSSMDGGPPSVSDLLNHHVHHWRNVRQSWKRKSAQADTRYEASARLLREMFSTQATTTAESATTAV